MGVGFFVAAFSLWFWCPPFILSVVLILPMLIDGILQNKTAYESNNILRLITGILFAYGLITFIVICDIWAYQQGQYVKEIML